MTRYAVSYETVASTIVYVNADSPADAQVKADDIFEPPDVCAGCAGWGSNNGPNGGIELGEWGPSEGSEGVWEA